MKLPKLAEAECWVAGVRPLPGVDPLVGAEVLGAPWVYWERPLTQEAVAGWGEAAVRQAHSAAQAREVLEELGSRSKVQWLDNAPEALPGPWFGGMRFSDQGGDAEWAAFGLGRWTLPEVLVWREGGGLMAAAFVPESPDAAELVRLRLEHVAKAFPGGYRSAGRSSQPLQQSSSRPDFEASVKRALGAITAGQMQKVVLARAVEVVGERAFDWTETLARLREQNAHCTTFLFRAPDGAAFLGATPETLCRLEGRMLETEALAGSTSPAQAGTLGVYDKDCREHNAVVNYIIEALRPLSERVAAAEAPELLTLKHVVHLRTRISAELREGVGLAELVAALHPTPAVGGTPREPALRFLLEYEALDRGWYAGPVGWVGPGRAHLMVGLRSAWLKQARARLFVGAGIVAGSMAHAEWQETELKSLAMLRALEGAQG